MMLQESVTCLNYGKDRKRRRVGARQHTIQSGAAVGSKRDPHRRGHADFPRARVRPSATVSLPSASSASQAGNSRSSSTRSSCAAMPQRRTSTSRNARDSVALCWCRLVESHLPKANTGNPYSNALYCWLPPIRTLLARDFFPFREVSPSMTMPRSGPQAACVPRDNDADGSQPYELSRVPSPLRRQIARDYGPLTQR
jgi:hypothetical protein